jgi:hypothetical protein
MDRRAAALWRIAPLASAAAMGACLGGSDAHHRHGSVGGGGDVEGDGPVMSATSGPEAPWGWGRGSGDSGGEGSAISWLSISKSALPSAGSGGAASSSSSSAASSSAAASSSSSAASSSSSSAASSSSAGAGGADAGCPPLDTDPAVPPTLSATGLYADIASKTLAPGVKSYDVSFPLWSDGLTKQRYIALPPCSTIDTSDMDHWSLPIGTKVWKQFFSGGVLLETRLIKRFGPNPSDYFFAAYQWRAAGDDADFVPSGVTDANGTTHDIPATWVCITCHGHLHERVLGFSALQLAHAGPGWTLDSLTTAGLLTHPIQGTCSVPGNAVEQAALGYLHANCGHCHNGTPGGIDFVTPLVLRLGVEDPTVIDTGAYQTAVGVPVEKFDHPGITDRITPGDPSSSCVSYRMGQRGSNDQMPPFGSEKIDPTGIAAVNAWINALP